ncbi:HAD-IIIC family phosphatase [Brevundimonas sp.]|uniref:HAD-IIIC family phosphatase n=1 Tax=Brevundimonas sp. TaxID=1871086 RepID=UPI004033BAD9
MSEAEAGEIARHYFHTRQFEAASKVVETWLKKNDGFWMQRERYEIAYETGDRDGAIEGLARLVREYPDIAAAYATYISRLIDADRLPEARSALAIAEPLFPDDVWILNHSADQAEKSGDLAKAFTSRRKSLSLQPDTPFVRTAMARALAAAGKTELLLRHLDGEDVEFGHPAVRDLDYLTPTDLRVTPTRMRRGLVIGSCLASGMPDVFVANDPFCEADYVITNNGMGLPSKPPRPLSDYDFQYIQLPLRSVLPEAAYFHLRYDQPDAYQALFDDTCQNLADQLADVMTWNVEAGLLTFVSNFLPPQQNPLGRLIPRYDLRNLVHFVERLNVFLSGEIAKYSNAHLLDIDQIAANIGRRNVQDDVLWTVNHAATLGDNDLEQDQQRLEIVHPASVHYPTQPYRFVQMIWREIEAMYRSIHQVDMVKMVLVDLDDTLWRGVLADNGSTDLEGWPLAFAEALLFLKQRGVILGIVSKNTEDRIKELWPYRDLLTLDDFAIRRINWTPKADNIAEILAEVNLLPKSVVFIDDNPVEREGVKRAFPEMRVFGSNPYLWRRILLWSAETQTATITAESANRSQMIQAQSKRESRRKTQSRGEFLASLNIRVGMKVIRNTNDPSFPRALELINKTNQFNTTGHRWTQTEAEAFLGGGGVFYAMTVVDDFTPYGLVGVLCVKDDQVVQFVMSCRVIGLEVELAAVAHVLADMKASGLTEARASIVETPANLLSRDIWARNGFSGESEFARALTDLPPIPSHIVME